MALRVCSTPGCPTLTDKPRCLTHRREAEQARGTRAERGYDAAHIRARAEWQRRIDSGEPVTCWRPTCRQPIVGRAWHLGHDDTDRSITRGPECITCNLSAAGRAAHGIPPRD